ncbi:hypothetical protein B0T17DRAFT_168702 [Bombardia bombarda]|uniref:Uncharacterized protein n=1 Tax=Bombardia bombarda TaxID=252184 RepID=A0AA39X8U1_9PEZI|nr:hypothetical protein B0T17DRAFT_168702 [Bombardia bombarda]
MWYWPRYSICFMPLALISASVPYRRPPFHTKSRIEYTSLSGQAVTWKTLLNFIILRSIGQLSTHNQARTGDGWCKKLYDYLLYRRLLLSTQSLPLHFARWLDVQWSAILYLMWTMCSPEAPACQPTRVLQVDQLLRALCPIVVQALVRIALKRHPETSLRTSATIPKGVGAGLRAFF